MTQPDAEQIAASILESGSCAYSRTLGMTYTEATKERVRAELTVTEDHLTVPDILHGGAVMSIADDMGAVGTVLNLPPGARTSTIESKTNFVRGVPLGEKALGESTPVHLGRTTMVWQTRISREDGKLAAVVTQTQIVLPAEG
jgi:uncharacterized protein (TIGR00369 family)